MKKIKMFYLVVVAVSVVMFSGIAQAGAVPDGFVGVPWGTGREQIIKAMSEQGYRQLTGAGPGVLTFSGEFAGVPCKLSFQLIANSFYYGSANHISEATSRQAVQFIFDDMLDKLSKKYGSPQIHESKVISASQEKDETSAGKSISFAWARWNLVDIRTSDKYSISVEFGNHWLSNGTLHYTIMLYYYAESLGKRLEKKDY